MNEASPSSVYFGRIITLFRRMQLYVIWLWMLGEIIVAVLVAGVYFGVAPGSGMATK